MLNNSYMIDNIFLLYSNKSMGIPENYKRYIKNNLRREFDLYNTPVHVIFRSSSDQEKGRPNKD